MHCDLAEYLKCATEMLWPLPYYDAVSRSDDIKTIINEAFVASSGDITDYNLFTHRVGSRHINITIFVMKRRNDKEQS